MAPSRKSPRDFELPPGWEDPDRQDPEVPEIPLKDQVFRLIDDEMVPVTPQGQQPTQQFAPPAEPPQPLPSAYYEPPPYYPEAAGALMAQPPALAYPPSVPTHSNQQPGYPSPSPAPMVPYGAVQGSQDLQEAGVAQAPPGFYVNGKRITIQDLENIAKRKDRIGKIVKLLDTLVEVKTGSKKRSVGLDAVAGLVPYAGPALTGILSAYPVVAAARSNCGGKKVAKMLLNIGIDSVGSLIPYVGVLFDAWWKACERNEEVFEEYLEEFYAELAERDPNLYNAAYQIGLIAINHDRVQQVLGRRQAERQYKKQYRDMLEQKQ